MCIFGLLSYPDHCQGFAAMGLPSLVSQGVFIRDFLVSPGSPREGNCMGGSPLFNETDACLVSQAHQQALQNYIDSIYCLIPSVM